MFLQHYTTVKHTFPPTFCLKATIHYQNIFIIEMCFVEQLGEEVPSNKTTIDIHTHDPVNNGIRPKVSSLFENDDNEEVLKPTEFLPDPSDKSVANIETVQSARKGDNLEQRTNNSDSQNIPRAGEANSFDEIDGESSNIYPTESISNSGRAVQSAPSEDLVAAGLAASSAPVSFSLDSPDCAVAPQESAGSKPIGADEKRKSTLKRKSLRQSFRKLWSRARGKKPEEPATPEIDSAARAPTPMHTPKPVRVERLQGKVYFYCCIKQ